MKRNFFGLFFVSLFLLIVPFIHGQEVEQINSFTANVLIQKDGSVQISENIEYNFGDEDKHGIFRNIPLLLPNNEGKKYRMEVRVNSITDEKGLIYKFDLNTEDNILALKIGDPNSTISGVHTYIIDYTVKGGLRYFSDHDEFYWNVTGNEWTVPIQSAGVIIAQEFEALPTQENVVCYTGDAGSTDKNCTIVLNGNIISVITSQPLYYNQGLTVAYRFPKNMVAVQEPVEVVEFFDTVQGKIVLLLLLICGLWWYIGYPVFIGIKWFMYGRDPHVGKEVTAWFDPPETKAGRKLTPAETGTILDEKIEMKDVAAMMVELARRGYYTIVEKTKGDFYLEKKNEVDKDLESYEAYFLRQLFKSKEKVRIKDAKLATTVEQIKKDMYEKLTKEDFFPENPEGIRTYYGVILALAGMTFNFPLLLSASVFGLNIVRKTITGAKAANVAKGMRNFLKSQERQMQYQGDKQLLFERLLPFAVAFGVEQQWSERFKDIQLQEPDWYQGSYSGSTFNSHVFGTSLHNSVNSFATSATPVSSSTGHSSGFSGGGSSGGGGGGGGGGSW